MLGSIIGDIIGSRFEFNNILNKEFELFTDKSTFTDDTVSTIATMDWLNTNHEEDFTKYIKKWYKKYPNVGFSPRFIGWINGNRKGDSYGNGAPMRIAPIGNYAFGSDEVITLSFVNSKTSHNSKEAMRGAAAIAMCVHYSKNRMKKLTIKEKIESRFGYDLDISLLELRKTNVFSTLAITTVPQSIACFLQSDSFEDAIRLAISIGGDSDTIACMTGGIAGTFYPTPKIMRQEALKRLPQEMVDVIKKFEKIIKTQESDENLAKRRFIME